VQRHVALTNILVSQMGALMDLYVFFILHVEIGVFSLVDIAHVARLYHDHHVYHPNVIKSVLAIQPQLQSAAAVNLLVCIGMYLHLLGMPERFF
jgi:hypothetical protein